MDDRGDKQAMCCWFLASVFSAGSQKFGPTHIIRWINTVPPGFVRLPVVALIPTDGRHNWEQSSKGQLVVSRRLHPGNPPCTAVSRSFTLLQKPFHPSASLLAFPDIPCNRTYPLLCLSVSSFDGNSNFVAKLAPPVFGSSINHER